MLYNGNEFNSFISLRDKVLEFEWAEGVQFKVNSVAKRCSKKDYNENIKYGETEYVCIHGGKKFNTTSTGERPNHN